MEASSGSRGLCRDAWGQTINGDKNERTDKTNKDRHEEDNNDENTNCTIIKTIIIIIIILPTTTIRIRKSRNNKKAFVDDFGKSKMRARRQTMSNPGRGELFYMRV